MSLIRPVLRMCAVAALRDRTWAESRVFDSDNTPLIDALQQDTKPYITVFTDADTRTDIDGKDIYTSMRRIALVLEIGLASATTVANGDKILNIPQTDQAMEALIDFIETQALSAIIGDPFSKWGEIVRRMVNHIERIPSIRGGSSTQTTTRWAARQLTLICQTVADPAPGTVLPQHHPIRDFITLAKSTEQAGLHMAEAANLIEAMLNESPAPDWRQAQAWMGMTEAAIRATGIAPLLETDETAPVYVEETVQEDETLEFPLNYNPFKDASLIYPPTDDPNT